MKGGRESQATDAAEKIHLADVKLIVRQPTIWLLCIILTAVFHVFWATIEFPSFAETGGFAMPLAAATALGTAKLWMRPFGAVLAGILGDRISNVRLIVWLFVAGIAGCLYLALVPTTPSFSWTLWVLVFPFGLIAYGLRGIFWALLHDCPVPTRALGTAIGFVSIMGYSSDAYIPQVSAWLQTHYDTGAAYQLFFAYIGAAAAVGMLASMAFERLTRSTRAETVTT